MADLLRKIVTVSVPGMEKFVAEDHLKDANIAWRGSNFDKLFLRKVEKNIGELTVAVYCLEKDSLDAPILTQLGDYAEINLAHFFSLIEKQSKGESGPLLVKGYANIAYIRGIDNNRWVVCACWRSARGCWFVGAYSVGGPDRWWVGGRVLSRARDS